MIALLSFALAVSAPQQTFTPAQEAYIKREMERYKQLKSLTNEQALIVYDQCISRAGVTLSRTDLADEAVYGQARLQCTPLKVDLLTGSSVERFAQFKKYDEDKSAAFPALTKQIRERRRQFEAESGKKNSAPHQ